MTGLINKVRRRALALSGRALEKLLSDDRRAARVASAVGKVQKGKARLDAAQDGALHAAQWATRADYKALGKRLSMLKRRVRELTETLGRLDEQARARKPGR